MEDPLIIGESKAILDLREFIKRAAVSDANVVILGETGVGKELAARAIHCGGDRNRGSFIKINCGGLSESLVESELYGHRRGAFTGALGDRVGLIEAANLGTCFIDEIGDASPILQAKLLSVIEDKELRRLGENIFRKISARFIFATNKDIFGMTAGGQFRQDLYFRLSTMSVHISALRERKEDLPALINHFLKKAMGTRPLPKRLSNEAYEALYQYSFPGNIRELESIISRACILYDSKVIEACHLGLSAKVIKPDNITFRLYKEMTEDGRSYWEVIHRPYMSRELNKEDVRQIIARGLAESGGSLVKLTKLFNVGNTYTSYKKFWDVIKNHGLKTPVKNG